MCVYMCRMVRNGTNLVRSSWRKQVQAQVHAYLSDDRRDKDRSVLKSTITCIRRRSLRLAMSGKNWEACYSVSSGYSVPTPPPTLYRFRESKLIRGTLSRMKANDGHQR